MAYGACANDMRSSRDALAKSRFPGVGKGLNQPLRALNVILYGVRPCSAQTFQDQLGGVRGRKSKIKDGNREGTSVTLATAVADF